MSMKIVTEVKRQLNKDVGSHLATGLIALGNAAAAAMVFAQLLSHQNIDFALIFGGVAALLILYALATIIMLFIGGK